MLKTEKDSRRVSEENIVQCSLGIPLFAIGLSALSLSFSLVSTYPTHDKYHGIDGHSQTHRTEVYSDKFCRELNMHCHGLQQIQGVGNEQGIVVEGSWNL